DQVAEEDGHLLALALDRRLGGADLSREPLGDALRQAPERVLDCRRRHLVHAAREVAPAVRAEAELGREAGAAAGTLERGAGSTGVAELLPRDQLRAAAPAAHAPALTRSTRQVNGGRQPSGSSAKRVLTTWSGDPRHAALTARRHPG